MRDLHQRYGDALAPLVIVTRNEAWNAYALVIGVTADFLRRIPLTAGVPYQEGSADALIGEVAARRLDIRAGQSLPIDGRQVRITGIFRTGSRLLDGGLMTDITHAQRMLTREGAERQYSLAVLRAGNAVSATALIDEVQREYPAFRAIPGTEFAGALRLLRVVDAFVKTLSVIAVVGTCLVVSNTLLMAIRERTREIGILMTVGWTPWLVLRMLFAEGVVLCVAGAATGTSSRWHSCASSTASSRSGSGGFPFVTLSLTWASLLMALGAAILAMAWPAVIVYRMQPSPLCAIDEAGPLLAVESLGRVFERGLVTALAEVTFNALAGEVVAVTGPSGCGKSTLLSLIGLLDL